MSFYLNKCSVIFTLCFLQGFFFQASNCTDSDNYIAEQKNEQVIKVVVSVVVIVTIFLIGLVLICICYKTTKRIENEAGKIRLELANEYQNALSLQLEEAVRVNTYLLKSLAPERPLMGKSMLKSSWKKSSSPKRLKPSLLSEGKILNLNKVEMSVNGNMESNV